MTPGEMNYLITRLLVAWLPLAPTYTDYNAVLGVLSSIQMEFSRRCISPYEDFKKAENGDVY